MARPDCISRVSHRRKEPVPYDSIKSGGIRERAMRAIEGRGEDRERTAASITSVADQVEERRRHDQCHTAGRAPTKANTVSVPQR
jgi:hypothetical protein